MEPTLLLDEQTAAILVAVATVLPMAVTALTKTSAPPWLKNCVNLLLAAGVTAVNEAVDSIDFTWTRFAWTWALTFALSALAYAKLWKDSPVHALVARLTRAFGVTAGAVVKVNTDSQVVMPVVVSSSAPVAIASSEVVAGVGVVEDLPATLKLAREAGGGITPELEDLEQVLAHQTVDPLTPGA